MSIQNEIDALHRIASAEEFGIPTLAAASGDFFSIEIDDDTLYAEVDFYSQRFAGGADDFDVDEWEREKLRLSVTPKNREGFYLTHALARGLLSGRSAVFADGVILNRDSHLGQVKAAGTDLTFLTIQLNVGV